MHISLKSTNFPSHLKEDSRYTQLHKFAIYSHLAYKYIRADSQTVNYDYV